MPYIVERNRAINVNNGEYKNPHCYNYPKNDLMSVFTHWDDDLKRNIPTENKLQKKG